MKRVLLPLVVMVLLIPVGPVRGQTPLSILVDGPAKKAGSEMPAVLMQNMVLSHLMKRGAPHWEFMDGGKGMGELLKQVEETGADAAQVPGRLSLPDLQIRLGPVACQDSACSAAAHLVEPATGRKAGMSLGRGKDARAAVTDLCQKLRQAVLAFDGKRQKQGGASTIRLLQPPEGMEAKVYRALKRACVRVQRQMASLQSASFRVRCKLDAVEMQGLLREAACGEEFEFVQSTSQLTIIRFK